MAAFVRLSKQLASQLSQPRYTASVFQSSSSSPAVFISRRGIATKLFVGGLSFYTTDKVLSEAFSQYGQVVNAEIPKDRVTGRSKGFGFVTYASEDEAENAIKELDGKPLNGRVIFIDYAKPRKDHGSAMPIARGPPEPASDR
ncbi:OLC1v1034141C1 [Oldenlandia corymbosa var. corymbosa]|uniref:OLC1v1034141C1 n=1 Tax=Oldenlandia corymbosa var. corymbosa TaxID=529605 RepID=A0AAV1CQM7_OLDCO|nr:OLC1v1034141C1 [Oldenlandia corymbosa var. corymbosa]